MRNHFQSPEVRQWHEEIEAEKRLARLDLFEDLAQLATEQSIAGLRNQLRARYKNLVGIEPEQRNVLRTALTRVVNGSANWNDEVAELLHDIAQQNGSSAGNGHGGNSDSTSDGAANSD